MNDGDGLARALDDLIADRSPRGEVEGLSADEQGMLRVAQLLRGTAPPPPAPVFVDELRGRLLARGRRLSRRGAVLSGLAALAAAVVGAVGLRKAEESSTNTPVAGSWFVVGTVAELGPGSVHPFTAGAIQGVVINRHGRYHAMSRICTHLHCVLKFEPRIGALLCPCHGAEFDLNGKNQFGPGGYAGELPPLPTLHVRVRGDMVEVLGA